MILFTCQVLCGETIDRRTGEFSSGKQKNERIEKSTEKKNSEAVLRTAPLFKLTLSGTNIEVLIKN